MFERSYRGLLEEIRINKDLQVPIILFTRNMSSHKTDWIRSEQPLPALSCLCRLNRNLHKCKQVACNVVFVGKLIIPLFNTALYCCFVYFLILNNFYANVSVIYLFIRWLSITFRNNIKTPWNILLLLYLLKTLIYEFDNCEPKWKQICVLVSLKLFIIRTTAVSLFKVIQQ